MHNKKIGNEPVRTPNSNRRHCKGKERTESLESKYECANDVRSGDVVQTGPKHASHVLA